MGYSLQFDLQPAVPVASIHGLGDFRRWLDTHPPEKTVTLRHLLEHGWTGKVGTARDELKAALSSSRPKSDVSDTADGILDALQKHGASEVVSLTDGVGKDTGTDDDADDSTDT